VVPGEIRGIKPRALPQFLHSAQPRGDKFSKNFRELGNLCTFIRVSTVGGTMYGSARRCRKTRSGSIMLPVSAAGIRRFDDGDSLFVRCLVIRGYGSDTIPELGESQRLWNLPLLGNAAGQRHAPHGSHLANARRACCTLSCNAQRSWVPLSGRILLHIRLQCATALLQIPRDDDIPHVNHSATKTAQFSANAARCDIAVTLSM
jgi:hypothetical protein